MARVRVLLDARGASDPFPGIGRYAFGLAGALPRAFPEIEFVIAWNPRIANRRFDWRTVEGLPNARRVECEGDGRGIADPFRIRRLVTRERAQRLFAPYFTSALASPVPSTVILHDLIPFLPGGGARSRVACWGIRRSARRAEVVVTPSEAVRAEAVSRLGLDPARVRAISPGAREIGAGKPPARELADRGYVLFVGVHKPHKNVHGLIEGHARAFAAGGPDLVLAGPETGETERLRRRARELGTGSRVHFVGEVSEAVLDGLYRGATIFAFASFSEGFGIPMLEAMTCRIPAVASDLPVFREFWGDAITYVDPASVESIASGLTLALARGPAVESGLEEGARRAALLSWPELARRYAICFGLGDTA